MSPTLGLAPAIFRMAVSSLRANTLRSLLTTLGIVIGVATVVAIASIIQGFNHTVEASITSFGSHVIYLRKVKPGFFSPELVDSLKHTPAFTIEDAEAIRRLCPDVREVSLITIGEGVPLKYRSVTTRGVQLLGCDSHVQEVNGYATDRGRFYTEEETRRSAQVVVIGVDLRKSLMGEVDPVGKIIHLGGIPFRIVGELEPKGKSLFFNPDETLCIPNTTITKYFPPGPNAAFFLPKAGQYYINAVAVSPERTPAAVDEITEVLRVRRGLTAKRPNNFAIFTEEALAELYNQLTGATYVVMILISSIALVVGGIGVMNTMLVAVTERTREIGLRKAVGAPPVTILLQFLFEAAMITGFGGTLGIALGAGVAQVVRAFAHLPAVTPLWSVLVAFLFSVAVGVFFGLYPAMRAARLDPVDALRWE